MKKSASREENVKAAIANGTFDKIRDSYNKRAGEMGYFMDAAGNISKKGAKERVAAPGPKGSTKEVEVPTPKPPSAPRTADALSPRARRAQTGPAPLAIPYSRGATKTASSTAPQNQKPMRPKIADETGDVSRRIYENLNRPRGINAATAPPAPASDADIAARAKSARQNLDSHVASLTEWSKNRPRESSPKMAPNMTSKTNVTFTPITPAAKNETGPDNENESPSVAASETEPPRVKVDPNMKLMSPGEATGRATPVESDAQKEARLSQAAAAEARDKRPGWQKMREAGGDAIVGAAQTVNAGAPKLATGLARSIGRIGDAITRPLASAGAAMRPFYYGDTSPNKSAAELNAFQQNRKRVAAGPRVNLAPPPAEPKKKKFDPALAGNAY